MRYDDAWKFLIQLYCARLDSLACSLFPGGGSVDSALSTEYSKTFRMYTDVEVLGYLGKVTGEALYEVLC